MSVLGLKVTLSQANSHTQTLRHSTHSNIFNMNLDKFLVVSGVPGVHKLITSRADGVIIEDRKEGRTRFVSARQGQVTPLATVAIYTYSEEGEGTVPLVDVFEKMFDQHEAIPPADVNANSQTLRDYFSQILPDHDRDRVHINDIKKCIKWYNFMYASGIFQEAKAGREAKSGRKKPQQNCLW